ncbi:MAG: YaaR family protein, partial [Candidatus Treponema excrementipullorum]|nr:YaaR family protein [Candidatus Treponema excrementipullorum]
ADIASDLVKTEFSLESFSNYRKAVSNLMKFIVHTNYEVKMNIRRRPSRRFKTEKFYLIDIVDKKIDKLAADILENHLETLQVLVRIDEINGLVVDLIT